MTGKAAYDYRTQDCLHTAIRADRADEMVARCRAVRQPGICLLPDAGFSI